MFKWLDFKITNRCNNNCVYCGVKHDPPNSPELLSNTQITNALYDAISLDFTHFAFLGGEPSIRKNISKIFYPFKSAKHATVLVITNGLVFNENMYRSAFESNAKNVKIVVSFDSFYKPNYKKQNPEKILLNIKKIALIAEGYSSQDINRTVEIHSVISRENFNNFSKLVRYFKELKIDISIGLVCPSEFIKDGKPNQYNKFNFTELEIILKQFEKLQKDNLLNFANKTLFEYLQKYPYGNLNMSSFCKAGKQHIIINSDGEVYPCITESYRRNLRFGNISKDQFKKIYRSMLNFKCLSDFAPACWDHYLWNKLEYLAE